MGGLGLVFDWDVIFQKLTVQLSLGLGPNYLTRIDHHGAYTVNVYRDLQGLYRDFCVQGF